MSTNTAKVFFWSVARKRDEMLELYDGKLSRTVLRRESGSNPADLAGTIFGGFAPNSQTADVLSRALGSYTVQSGSISRSKGENSQSLQMAERALMTPDELKSIPKGNFVVMKTGSHPMKTRLRLFLDWGITFDDPYQMPEHGQRKVYYAGRQELEQAIQDRFWLGAAQETPARSHQEGRAGVNGGAAASRRAQDSQPDQPLATIPNFVKKQDGPPPDAAGG